MSITKISQRASQIIFEFQRRILIALSKLLKNLKNMTEGKNGIKDVHKTFNSILDALEDGLKVGMFSEANINAQNLLFRLLSDVLPNVHRSNTLSKFLKGKDEDRLQQFTLIFNEVAALPPVQRIDLPLEIIQRLLHIIFECQRRTGIALTTTFSNAAHQFSEKCLEPTATMFILLSIGRFYLENERASLAAKYLEECYRLVSLQDKPNFFVDWMTKIRLRDAYLKLKDAEHVRAARGINENINQLRTSELDDNHDLILQARIESFEEAYSLGKYEAAESIADSAISHARTAKYRYWYNVAFSRIVRVNLTSIIDLHAGLITKELVNIDNLLGYGWDAASELLIMNAMPELGILLDMLEYAAEALPGKAKEYLLNWQTQNPEITSASIRRILENQFSNEDIPVNNSFSFSDDAVCKNCGNAFKTETWFIIDVTERPDLFNLVKQEKLNLVICPKCGHRGLMDSPLLLFRPNDEPVLTFVPLHNTTPEYIHQMVEASVDRLRVSVGAAWQKEWAENLQVVEWDRLGEVVQLEPTAINIVKPALVELTQALGQAIKDRNFEKVRGVLHSNPIFFERKAEEAIDELIHRYQSNSSDLIYLSTLYLLRILLQGSRKNGIDATLDELNFSEAKGENIYSLIIESNHAMQSADWASAVTSLRRALDITNKNTNPSIWALLHSNLATALSKDNSGDITDNQEQAFYHFSQALTILSHVGAPKLWVVAIINLGVLYKNRINGEKADNLEKAIYYLEEVLSFLSPENDKEEWGAANMNLGVAYLHRVLGKKEENFKIAIDYLEAAHKVCYREDNPSKWGMIHFNLGNVYRVRGGLEDNQRAIIHYQKALATLGSISPLLCGLIEGGLGAVYSNLRSGDKEENIESAINHFERALQLVTHQESPLEWAAIKNSLGNTIFGRIKGNTLENKQKAIGHIKDALKILYQVSNTNKIIDIEANLASYYWSLNQLTDAHQAYHNAIKAGEILFQSAYTDIGRITLAGSLSKIYAEDAYCLIQLAQYPEALLQSERGKTRLLDEALTVDNINNSVLTSSEKALLQTNWHKVRDLEMQQRLSQDNRTDYILAKYIHNARAELRESLIKLRESDPYFASANYCLDNIKKLIPADGAIVIPLFTDNGAAAFVMPANVNVLSDEYVVHLSPSSLNTLKHILGMRNENTSDAERIGTYVKRSLDPDRWNEGLYSLGEELWNLLMGPVHERLQAFGLKQGAPVVIIPQGGLNLLPLHAAWRKVDGNWRTFMDDYTVSYSPSCKTLKAVQDRSIPPDYDQFSILLVTNPTDDLPYTTTEGLAVAELVSDVSPVLLDRHSSTVDAVIKFAIGKTHIHFACHGQYNWEDPMKSGLVFRNGDTLKLAEIATTLDLSRCRLVVLSACETAATDINRSPEEFIGLPSAFFQAGGTAVVGTLWAVNDFSTSILMERFYDRYIKFGMTPVSALRDAQLWLRNLTSSEVETIFKDKERGQLERHLSGLAISPSSDDKHKNKDTEHPFEHPLYWAAFTYLGI